MTGKEFREEVGGLQEEDIVEDGVVKKRYTCGHKRAFREVVKKLKVMARA